MQSLFQEYQLVTQLARGTASTRLLAQSPQAPDEQVVFKVFESVRFEQIQEQERFQQEVQRLKQLHHPYILPLLSGEVRKGHPILASKYMSHGSLLDRLSSISPERILLGEALQIIVQIGQALSYAHAWNVLHGNIKPGNILFDANGHALLTDFTLPSIMASNAPHQQTVTGYMAPEQLAGRSSSKESDQYALGCLAYEILTGQPPVSHQDGGSPVPLDELVSGIPRHIEIAVLKALADDPTQRHANITAFIESFTAYTLKVSAIPQTVIFPEVSEETGPPPEGADRTGILSESAINNLIHLTPEMSSAMNASSNDMAFQMRMVPAPVMADAQISDIAAMAPPQWSVPEPMQAAMASSQWAAAEPMQAPYASEMTVMEPAGAFNGSAQPWQSAPANGYPSQWQQGAGNTPFAPPKRKISRSAWIAIALACIVVLTAGTVPMLLPLANNQPKATKQQTVTPIVQNGGVTTTVAQATPTDSADAAATQTAQAPTPTSQDTPIAQSQATAPTPVPVPTQKPTATPRPTPKPTATPTPKPTATPKSKATATPTPWPTPTPLPTPAPVPTCCLLCICSSN